MMHLAPKLDISSEELNQTFEKHCPDEVVAVSSSKDELWIQKANYDILTNWLNNQSSEEDAYVLNDALVASGLNLQALCLSLTEKDLKRLVYEMRI